jgi:phage terminase large subunit-like protein
LAVNSALGQCRLDYNLKMLAFDRWGSTKIVTDHGRVRVYHRSGADIFKNRCLSSSARAFRACRPTKEFAKLVSSRKIAHDGNPAMRWQVGNVVIGEDAANQKPSKAKVLTK